MCVCVYVYMRARTHPHPPTPPHTNTDRHTHTHIQTHKHTHACMHEFIHTYIHTYMHACICDHPRRESHTPQLFSHFLSPLFSHFLSPHAHVHSLRLLPPPALPVPFLPHFLRFVFLSTAPGRRRRQGHWRWPLVPLVKVQEIVRVTEACVSGFGFRFSVLGCGVWGVKMHEGA